MESQPKGKRLKEEKGNAAEQDAEQAGAGLTGTRWGGIQQRGGGRASSGKGFGGREENHGASAM